MRKLLHSFAIICVLPLLLAFSKPGEEFVGVWVHDSMPDVKMDISLDRKPFLIKLYEGDNEQQAQKVTYDKGTVSFKASREDDAVMFLVLDEADKNKLVLTVGDEPHPFTKQVAQ